MIKNHHNMMIIPLSVDVTQIDATPSFFFPLSSFSLLVPDERERERGKKKDSGRATSRHHFGLPFLSVFICVHLWFNKSTN
jgi:hypothetical protein